MKEYRECIKDNELFTIPEALNAIASNTIFHLTSDIKTRKLIGVSREAIEETLKCLKIVSKILAKRSYAIWD